MRRKQQQLPACAVSVEPDEFLGFLFLAAEKQPLSLSPAAAKPAPAHDLASTHARIIADVVDRPRSPGDGARRGGQRAQAANRSLRDTITSATRLISPPAGRSPYDMRRGRSRIQLLRPVCFAGSPP